MCVVDERRCVVKAAYIKAYIDCQLVDSARASYMVNPVAGIIGYHPSYKLFVLSDIFASIFFLAGEAVKVIEHVICA